MNVIKTTFDNVSDLVAQILSSQTEACVYCVGDENCVIVGSNGGVNRVEVERLGVKMVEIKHEGGTIVASPGDVQIGIFTQGYKGDEYRKAIIGRLMELLLENGHSASLEQNDILVNGKKVAGFGSRMFGNILYTAFQISVNVDINLIKSICTKPMVKTPDGLSNYGVTTDHVLNILFDIVN